MSSQVSTGHERMVLVLTLRPLPSKPPPAVQRARTLAPPAKTSAATARINRQVATNRRIPFTRA
jgi:hypothetical protein